MSYGLQDMLSSIQCYTEEVSGAALTRLQYAVHSKTVLKSFKFKEKNYSGIALEHAIKSCQCLMCTDF